jgi:anti-sigma regulatory factor (Ser/Thr protein kinase)
VSVVEQHVIPLDEVARGRLVAAIKEAMQNTLDHAYRPDLQADAMAQRWWMSARVDLVDREVMILLYDQGVGIPVTMPADYYHHVRAALSGNLRFAGLRPTPSDGSMIMAATKLYATRTGDPSRGRGFRNMQKFVDVCEDGELRVLSNRGSYSYMTKAEAFTDNERSISGTVVEWRFRSDGLVEMKDD